MNVLFIIISVLFIASIVIGLPLAIIQYRTASKELKKLKTKDSYLRNY